MLKLTPSAAPRWVPCAASAQAESQYPRDDTKHAVTAEGIAIHWAVERVLMSWHPRNTPRELTEFIGTACPENGVIITEELVWAGMQYLEHIWSVVHESPEAMMPEHQVSVDRHIKGVKGRVDNTWQNVDKTLLVVWDFKAGYTSVSPVMNWQLLLYAMGLVGKNTQAIELVIVQPRGRHAGDPVKTWLITIGELREHAGTLISAAIAARGPNPKFLPGPHCSYCKHAANCDALGDSSFGAMQIAGAEIQVEMTEAQIAYELQLLKRAKDAVQARTTALSALAVSRIQTGKIVPGYSYRPSKGNRHWTKSPEQIAAFGLLFGVDLTEQKTVTPAQASVRGIDKDMVNLFTERPENAAVLKSTDPNKAREVFQK